jgi:hypothetical protein
MKRLHSGLRHDRRWRQTAWLVASIVWLAGCGGAGDQLSVVTGQVKVGATPLGGGTVVFMADDGRAGSAELTPEGRYVLRCEAGRYKVAVTPPSAPDPLASPATSQPTSPPPGGVPIPKRYQDFGTSGLSFEVKAGENQFDIALTR